MTPKDIVNDVNGALNQIGVPALTFPPEAGGPLTETKHSVDRPFENSPFRLVHLWIDIRPTCPTGLLSTPAKVLEQPCKKHRC